MSPLRSATALQISFGDFREGLYYSTEMHTEALPANIPDRVQQLADEWRLTLEESFETDTSVISFVTRDSQELVLKVIKRPNDDEWDAGKILKLFNGQGVVRVYEYKPGAVLLERLRSGNNLISLALGGRDAEATEIIGDVIQRMPVIDGLALTEMSVPTVAKWGQGFGRYLTANDQRIPRELVESAQRVFANLCDTQSQPRLLHGDLQHYNVLFDSRRGWVTIDPKGVVGELEYEIGAVLRNPVERPDLFLSPRTIERRIGRLTNKLNINGERVCEWAFSQAVLSAIWDIEDGFEVSESHSALRLAKVIRTMLGNSDPDTNS